MVTCLRTAFPSKAGVPFSTTSNRIDSGRPGARPYSFSSKIFTSSGRRCDCQALVSTIFAPLVVVNGSGSTYVPALASM